MLIKKGEKPPRGWAYTPLEERFWSRVQKTRGCWQWLGTTVGLGYGMIYVNGRSIGAHRFSWERVNGPVPEGLYVLHKCDNPPCVRPDHLFLGTHKDNFEDMRQKGRWYNHFAHVTYTYRGEESGTAKLTDEKVRQIRKLRAADPYTWTLIALARKMGVSKRAVLFVVQGKTWSHVR